MYYFHKDMPIFSHKIRIDVNLRSDLLVIHDFNARFTREAQLWLLFVTSQGFYVINPLEA